MEHNIRSGALPGLSSRQNSSVTKKRFSDLLNGPSEQTKGEKTIRLLWKLIIISSLVILLLLLPLSDFFSFYFVVLGFGGVTITVFTVGLLLVLTLPCWYFGACSIIGMKTKKLKDHCCGPKWRWSDCASSCFMNGWLCYFFLIFCVLGYLFFMMSIWAPSTNANYLRFTVLADSDSEARPETVDHHDYIFEWASGYAVNTTAGRRIETKSDELYCVYPVLPSHNVALNTTEPLHIKVLIGCLHHGNKDHNGKEFTCYNVVDSEGHPPNCWRNLNKGNLTGLVSLNRKDYLWDSYDYPWEHAMKDLTLHWNETHLRPIYYGDEYVIVDLLTWNEFDELKHEAKLSFIILVVFIHVTIIACLFCWAGCFWITTQICRREWFDDELYVAYDEEGQGLMRSARRNVGVDDKELGEQHTRLDRYKAEREVKKSESRAGNVRRGQYDLLDDNTFQL